MRDLGIALNDYLLGRLVLPEGDVLYEATRVSLRRRADDRALDVYEMYWADLSRLGTGGLRLIRDIFPVSLKTDGLRNDALVTTPSPAHHLERITAPTLAISAKDDLYGTYVGAKYAAEQIPGARLVSYPTGGHSWLGHDAEVREALVSFLRGISPQ